MKKYEGFCGYDFVFLTTAFAVYEEKEMVKYRKQKETFQIQGKKTARCVNYCKLLYNYLQQP